MIGCEIRLSEEPVDKDYFFFCDDLIEVIRIGSTFSYCWFSGCCEGVSGFHSEWIYQSKAEALRYAKRYPVRYWERMPDGIAWAIGYFGEMHPELFIPKEFDSIEEAMAGVEEAKKMPRIKTIEVFSNDGSYLHFSRKNGQWERLE